MPTVVLEAGEFSYVEYGDRAAPPLVLLHGMPSDASTWDGVPAITAPTLVIGGGSTSPVPQQLLAKLAGLVPDATLVTIEGAGHAVHRNRPAEFLDAVRPFLQRIRTDGPSPVSRISRVPRG
jgi:pimeloyl-ACP methyl ester carboxylesterase